MRGEKETAHRLATYSDAVSFVPFATAWVARTRLASPAVALYAGLFVCIDIAYNVFTSAILLAFAAPRVAFGLVCAALILHVRPEAPSFTNR